MTHYLERQVLELCKEGVLVGGVSVHEMIEAGEQVVDACVERQENEGSEVGHLGGRGRNVTDDHGGNNEGL